MEGTVIDGTSHHMLYWMQFLSRPFVVGDRIDIASGSGAKFATGYVERVDPIYTVLRTDTGLPVTIPNKVRPKTSTLPQSIHHCSGHNAASHNQSILFYIPLHC